jgi:predicted dehydrogenase
MKPVTIAIAGYGQRGGLYASYARRMPNKAKVVAVADANPKRLAIAAETNNLDGAALYPSAEDMLRQPKLADMLIISTQDRLHYGHIMLALESGYDAILLEKPISPDLRECIEIRETAARKNARVAVTHVMRYTPFFRQIKDWIDAGKIGKLMAIHTIECVAYWHMAHSFVRGNWRNSDESAPMILAKSCHDMDMLHWLAGSKCQKVSSFGSLSHFKRENAPPGSAERCVEACAVKQTCPYNAERFYQDEDVIQANNGWPRSILTGDPTPEGVSKALREGPYGRCVYRCDNNVVDHQTVTMLFGDEVTVNFTMAAFTHDNTREIKVMGTHGEISGKGSSHLLTLTEFGKEPVAVDVSKAIRELAAGHGGGDIVMVEEFIDMVRTGAPQSVAASGIEGSVHSHVMALAAEHSRIHGGMAVDLAEFEAAYGR